MTISIPSHLSDPALVAEVTRLARLEHEATAALVAHLAEFDARRLYLGAGFPSLFAYCTEVLRLSEHGTYNRIEAARVVRKCPVILEMLGDGSLNLATVRLLAPHLTIENHRSLLEAAAGRSKREVAELVVRHFPRRALRTLVRKLPARNAAGHPAQVRDGDGRSGLARRDDRLAPSGEIPRTRPDGSRAPSIELSVVRLDARRGPSEESDPSGEAPLVSRQLSARPTATPLAQDRYQFRFTASAETYRKLREVQELLSHTIPDGDLGAIFDKAITLLRDELSRRKLGATDRPRTGAVKPGSRHIPAQVRRAVWRRDGGQCAFVAGEGHRCAARRFLEFHHVQPYGVGGEATIGNIRLRCRAHNAYEAGLFYGGAVRTRRREGTSKVSSALQVSGIGATRPGASSAMPSG